MLKINSKKKVNKPANTLKPQFAQKKPLVQPEWNATNSDLDRYRLSKAEQVKIPSEKSKLTKQIGSEKSLFDFQTQI